MTRNKWHRTVLNGEIAPVRRESDTERLAYGAGFERLNRAWVIIPGASLIAPLRYRPHSQKIVWRRPQQIDTGLSG
ncbi:MAG: hypothetical protein ACLQFI_14220 [Methylocella sp.]